MSDIERLLHLLYKHRDLLEQIYVEREMYFQASEKTTLDTLFMLRRERVVRTEPDGTGGVSVRLSSHVRELLNTTQRKRRLQSIGVGVTDALDELQHHVDSWKAAVNRSDEEVSGDYRDDIMDLLDNLELLYEEQLEQLGETISTSYGFDDRREQNARDFRFYQRRLIDMVDSTRELDAALDSEEYEGIEPVERATVRIAQRLRKHGAEIARLRTELERYLIQMRDRQAQTRRWARKVQWLRRQRGRLQAPNALAAAGELELLHRPAGMNLRGRPDLADPLLETDWSDVFTSALRWRRQQLRPRTVEREEPGRRSNTPESELEAKRRAREAEAKKWRPVQWLGDYLTEVVRRARDGEPAQSALEYWQVRRERAAPGDVIPTARAWLNEVALAAIANREIHGRRFKEAFEAELYPPLVPSTHRTEEVLHDVTVTVVPGALERFSKPQARRVS